MSPVLGKAYPAASPDRGPCPPEDFGGDIGNETLLEAWLDPPREKHEANRRWAPRKFEPKRCDDEAVNRAIARALRLSRGGYRARLMWVMGSLYHK